MRVGVSFLRPLLVPMSVAVVAVAVAVVVVVVVVVVVAVATTHADSPVVAIFFLLAVALDFCIVKKMVI